MQEMKVGFAKVEITPPLGIPVAGYNQKRYADGILDPLYAMAVVFDDGEKRAVLVSLDLIGIAQVQMDTIRNAVAARVNTQYGAVFVECTHTHTGPEVRVSAMSPYDEDKKSIIAEYGAWLQSRICDAASLAVQDLAPAKFLYTRGKADKVSFVRRYRMQDGSVLTNPGALSPYIVEPASENDEQVQLLIIKRENAPEIGIVNFQVHPDVITGSKISADYPQFVRQTYEKLIDHSHCVYINGAQGDSNHMDWSLWGTDKCSRGYDRARYMGRKIAMAAVANYELAEPISCEGISFGQRLVTAKYNKGRDDELAMAAQISDYYQKHGLDETVSYIQKLMGIKDYVPGKTLVRRYLRIENMKAMPEECQLYVTALRIGDWALAGIPGEPFTEVGLQIKARSRHILTMPVCAANGYEGYYPIKAAFDEGGYEAETARYVAGTAENLVDTSVALLNSL